MSDDTMEGGTGQDTGEVSPEVLHEAKLLGFVPKEQFRGKVEDWVDVATFVERGKHVLPILKANNERLMQEIRARDGQLGSLQESLRAANAAIEALQASHDEDVQAQVEAARAELRDEIRQASENGDHAALADATVKLSELNNADRSAETKDKSGAGTGRGNGTDQGKGGDDGIPVATKVEVLTWFDRHPDFRVGRRAALGNAIADEMRQKGDMRVGAAFLDDVAAEVERYLGETPGGGAGRVSGGNGGSGRQEGGGSSGKSYADLPAEAKAACEKAARRVVGENRAHKTIESWRKSYVQQYFSE